MSFVGDVAWGDNECKSDPEEEGPNGKEAAIVEKDSGPADDAGEEAEGGGEGGEDEL